MLFVPGGQVKNCLRLSPRWSNRASTNSVFSFVEIEALAGLFEWISTACPAIIAAVAALQAMKHSLKRSGRHWVPAARQQSSFWQLFSLIEAERATVRGCFTYVLLGCAHRSGRVHCFWIRRFCWPHFISLIHAWSPDERAHALDHCDQPIRESIIFF